MVYVPAMSTVDLNLLPALDALLSEGSVTGAARRLGLSTSAMSRTLTRLRTLTGDPLLVRAGRGLVPTAHAAELRDRVQALSRDAQAVLSPSSAALDLASLDQTFTVRANDGFIERFSAPLLAAVAATAPRVRLRFAPKPDKDAQPLRDGRIDLEIGVLGTFAPEVRVQAIFRDDFVGAARIGHPLLKGRMTAKRYAACQHVVSSRRGAFTGPVDDALAELGLRREIVAVVPGFAHAIRIASESDLIALVPRSCVTGVEPQGVVAFELPVSTPQIVVSAMWHPRAHTDPAQRWLRSLVMTVCRAIAPPP